MLGETEQTNRSTLERRRRPLKDLQRDCYKIKLEQKEV